MEENKWKESEKCLSDVSLLAPDEDYIRKHLQIVRAQLAKIEKQNQGKGKPKTVGDPKRWQSVEECKDHVHRAHLIWGAAIGFVQAAAILVLKRGLDSRMQLPFA